MLLSAFTRLNKLWRSWLRNESPRRPVLKWSRADKAGLILVSLFVALISSLHLLGKTLTPGEVASIDVFAPEDALVQDINTLQLRRQQLNKSTFVQIVNKEESVKLKKELNRKLQNIELSEKTSKSKQIGRVKLNEEERLWLSDLSPSLLNQWKNNLLQSADRMLSQGLVHTSHDQLRKASSLQLELAQNEWNTTPARSLGSKLLADTFHGSSNLQKDEVGQKRLIEEILNNEAIPPIQIKRGQLITRKGERITPQAYAELKYFKLDIRNPRPLAWLMSFSESLASCGVLLLIMRREKPCLQARHGVLALVLLLIAQISKIFFGVDVSPLAVIAPPTLLISQGLGCTSALAWMAVGSLFWPVPVNGIGQGRMMIACAAAAVVAFQGGRMRSRAQLLQMGVLLPFGALLSEWLLLRSQLTTNVSSWGQIAPFSNKLIEEALFVGGLLMITILFIPILESTFGLITKARLMELADQERPLLRRLSSEAPGTFEHTLMICGLAEEGARTIGADVDLIRTGALYHDIGKLHAPKWFIENQIDGDNPHDQLNDPKASANVLQAHVDEGLKLARRHRLPRPVADFIPEHQGTLKMGYFLHRARELNPSTPEREFRYRGPVPRSRETAILMLADGCEAALRSLNPNTTDNEACLTVKRIVESRQLDGQLKESSLSRSEVELVVRAFVRVWRRMRHRRIPYPIPRSNTFPA